MASISEQAQDIPTDELRSQLDGELITPNDSSYDEARHVFFKGIDRRPLAVARVAGAADVARVVTAARETGLDLAVRSGGHNRAGHGTSEGGLVIDLSGMNAVEIDPDGESAWVETGATAGQYTKATGGTGARHRLRRHRLGRDRRDHPRRRDRLPGPQERADDRRPARRRGGHRRWPGRRGERGLGAGPLLGHPRRRVEFRHRHPLPVPAARDLRDRRRHDDPAGDAARRSTASSRRPTRRRRSSRPSPTWRSRRRCRSCPRRPTASR